MGRYSTLVIIVIILFFVILYMCCYQPENNQIENQTVPTAVSTSIPTSVSNFYVNVGQRFNYTVHGNLVIKKERPHTEPQYLFAVDCQDGSWTVDGRKIPRDLSVRIP